MVAKSELLGCGLAGRGLQTGGKSWNDLRQEMMLEVQLGQGRSPRNLRDLAAEEREREDQQGQLVTEATFLPSAV